MRKLTILLVTMVMVFSMAGCGNTDSVSTTENSTTAKEVYKDRVFELYYGARVNSEKDGFDTLSTVEVFVDPETGVNYLFFDTAKGSGATPRYNADGTLYVSEP